MIVSRYWLCHTATLKRKETQGANPFEPSTEKSFELCDVRISTNTNEKVNLNTTGEKDGKSATLFYFGGVSKVDGNIKDFTFKVGDKVIFNEFEWNVIGINPVYNDSALHHTEVELA